MLFAPWLDTYKNRLDGSATADPGNVGAANGLLSMGVSAPELPSMVNPKIWECLLRLPIISRTVSSGPHVLPARNYTYAKNPDAG
jgi:hypothetical protein